MIKTKTRLFNISSNNAINGSYKSKITVQLPDLAFHNEKIQNVYLSVNHCEVPNSFYVVNYTNNQIVINSITYTVAVGNYNVNTFITALLSVLPTGYTITYSSITNKFTFNYTSNFTINASNKNCTLNRVIGLGTTDITSVTNILILPYVVNFLPLQRINFRTNFFNFNNYNSSDGSSDVFLPLQNNAGQLSMINYINQTGDEYLVQDRTISTFIISVTDDYNNLINFNGVDWTMTLTIKIDYLDETDLLQTFNNIIKSQNY